MTIEHIQIPVRDGYKLSAKLYSPEGESLGFVQIHCGTGIPQKLYSNFAAFMADKGYTALTFDYRGIAESAPENLNQFGHKLSDWGKLDMTGILDWAMVNFPNQKKIIIAHSMGGQLIGLMDNHKHIDQFILIASSTGYWRDMNSPYKWFPAFFWYVLVPVHLKIYGYINAMKIRQGENLPKGIVLQWRNWCLNPNYFELDFGKDLDPLFFDKITAPVKAILIQDDPLANKITSRKLLNYFSNTQIEFEEISPKAIGVAKIGHAGFFSRKFKNTLWTNLVDNIN